MKKLFFFQILIIICSQFLFSQDLSQDQKNLIESYKKQIENHKTNNNLSGAVNYLTKIANIYSKAKIHNEAINYLKEALDIANKTSNTTAISNLNLQLAYQYNIIENFAKAEEHFTKSYNLIKDYSDRTTVAYSLLNIAQTQQKQGKYDAAIETYNDILSIALELDSLKMVKETSIKLSKCYEAIGDKQNQMKYANLSYNFDKKINERKNKLQKQKLEEKEKQRRIQTQIAKQKELKLKAEKYRSKMISDSLALQKKKNEALNQQQKLQKIELEKKEADLKHQQEISKARNRTIIILFAGLGIILIGFLLILRLFYINKQQKQKLEKMNKELSQKNQEIEIHRKELEKKNKKITDSINYASRIQRAILPLKIAIEKNFKDVCIFYRPRDVVSGDFYWFAKINESKIIAAIDCTGHSVPGAFVSMIANTLLNEIVKTKGKTKLNEILHLLNKGVIETLNTSKDKEMNDGMDISLFRVDNNSKVAKFAAANHISIIFTNNKMHILEGDFHSIGGFSDSTKIKFTEQDIELSDDNKIYMYSDGFIDQFNEKGKKYLSKNFFKFIQKIHKKPLKIQEQEFSKEFYRWKGNFRQIDDVLVIGLEI